MIKKVITITIVITICFCYDMLWITDYYEENIEMSDIKIKTPMEHLNIGQFNRGQSSKLIRNLVEHEDRKSVV